MYLQEVVLASPPPQLSHSFDKRRTLNVPHCATELNDAHVGCLVRIVDRYPRDPLDPVLDGIGQVRDNLHRAAEVVASTLTLDNMLVDLSSRNVVLASQGDVEVSLVVA